MAGLSDPLSVEQSVAEIFVRVANHEQMSVGPDPTQCPLVKVIQVTLVIKLDIAMQIVVKKT